MILSFNIYEKEGAELNEFSLYGTFKFIVSRGFSGFTPIKSPLKTSISPLLICFFIFSIFSFVPSAATIGFNSSISTQFLSKPAQASF